MKKSIAIKNRVYNSLINIYEKEKLFIIDMIIETVDDNLPEQSNMDFEKYKEALEDDLLNFPFIRRTGSSVGFDVPTKETFEFEGLSLMIEKLMYGDLPIVDEYRPDEGFVEVSYEQFKKIDDYLRNSTPHFLMGDAYNAGFPDEDPVWVAPYSSLLKRIIEDMAKSPHNISLQLIPWTRVGEVDIFERSNKYYKENEYKWIDQAIDNATLMYRRGKR